MKDRAMKFHRLHALFSSLLAPALIPLLLSASAADLTATIAGVSRYESGGDVRPLREIERLVAASTADVQLRAQLEGGLAGILTDSTTFEGRRFACQQLAVIGHEACVPALARLLTSDETVGIACAALAQNPSEQAGAALRTALGTTSGRSQAQVAFALGIRRERQADAELARLARSADLVVAEAAVIALGRSGQREARATLAGLRKDAPEGLRRAVAQASLEVAEWISGMGETTEAAGIYAELLAPGNPDDIRRGAFGGLVRIDADGGEKRMLGILEGSDASLKASAIAALPELKSPGASKAFGALLSRLEPEFQLLLVHALALRGDAEAIQAVTQHLGFLYGLERTGTGLVTAKGLVGPGTIAALGQMGDASTVAVLARAVVAIKDAGELKAIELALANLKGGEAVDQALAAQLRNRMAGPKAPFLAALVRRASPSATGVFLAETASTDPTMVKLAFQGLRRTATADQLPAVLDALANLKATTALEDVQASVGQLLKRVGSPSANAAAVRAALARSSGRESQAALLPMLAMCPDAEGLKLVEAAANAADAETRDLGLRTLADWPEASAWVPLSALYSRQISGTERVLVLRGLARLLGEQNAKPDSQLISRYREMFDRAASDSDLKLLLGALAGCHHPEALKLAVGQAANPNVRAEAALAVRKIAENIRAQYPDEAKAALEQLK